MKNLLKLSLLAVLTFISVGVYAYDDAFSLKVKANNQKSIMFFIKEAQDVDFSIYGSDNEILYKQKIHAVQPLARTYNLDAFPDGSYLLKLETDLKITEYNIQIENGKTMISEPKIKEKSRLTLVKEKAIVKLDIENVSGGPVELKIINEYNDEMYSKVYTDKSKLNKKFNIGQTDAKQLTFILRFDDQEFVQTVSVN